MLTTSIVVSTQISFSKKIIFLLHLFTSVNVNYKKINVRGISNLSACQMLKIPDIENQLHFGGMSHMNERTYLQSAKRLFMWTFGDSFLIPATWKLFFMRNVCGYSFIEDGDEKLWHVNENFRIFNFNVNMTEI